MGQNECQFRFIFDACQQSSGHKNISLVCTDGVHQVGFQSKEIELGQNFWLIGQQLIGHFLNVLGYGIAVKHLATAQDFINHERRNHGEFLFFADFFFALIGPLDVPYILQRFFRTSL